jgi:hypothetical protein
LAPSPRPFGRRIHLAYRRRCSSRSPASPRSCRCPDGPAMGAAGPASHLVLHRPAGPACRERFLWLGSAPRKSLFRAVTSRQPAASAGCSLFMKQALNIGGCAPHASQARRRAYAQAASGRGPALPSHPGVRSLPPSDPIIPVPRLRSSLHPPTGSAPRSRRRSPCCPPG